MRLHNDKKSPRQIHTFQWSKRIGWSREVPAPSKQTCSPFKGPGPVTTDPTVNDNMQLYRYT